jgi:hypothetical protein
MSCLDRNKTLRNLKKKGFVESSKNSPDHIYLILYHEGKLVAHTKISHSGDDIRDPLIKAMSSQCKLVKSQFIDLANCPLSKDNYLKILEEGDYLD